MSYLGIPPLIVAGLAVALILLGVALASVGQIAAATAIAWGGVLALVAAINVLRWWRDRGRDSG